MVTKKAINNPNQSTNLGPVLLRFKSYFHYLLVRGPRASSPNSSGLDI
jgi:hypothetical protein